MFFMPQNPGQASKTIIPSRIFDGIMATLTKFDETLSYVVLGENVLNA